MAMTTTTLSEKLPVLRRPSLQATAAVAGLTMIAWTIALEPETLARVVSSVSMSPGVTLRWLVALLPGCIILNHAIYLATSRRKQYRQAVARMETASALENQYFGYAPLTIRYVIPAILVTVLCALAIAALSNPGCYLPWLYTPVASGAHGEVSPAFSTLCTVDSGLSTVSPEWPLRWAGQVLRGAALGFIGAYVYLLILLTDRGRQRDITTGIAMWAAAMPILGAVVGGVAALLVVSGTGSQAGSFTEHAVYFVAGMLPRQFALFVQAGVSKMFHGSPEVMERTVPLIRLRGVGAEVATRLQEEGISDVSALAYVSVHQLIRATTFSPRQVVDWIDEALLVVNVPSHWEALENVGVTGAMDLAWYDSRPAGAIDALADEIKFNAQLLKDIVVRLCNDAQVHDLRALYWDECHRTPQAE